jgi:hypothetical protein
VIAAGMGPCAFGESRGDPCPCDGFVFKELIYRGDSNYEKFKYLYEDE